MTTVRRRGRSAIASDPAARESRAQGRTGRGDAPLRPSSTRASARSATADIALTIYDTAGQPGRAWAGRPSDIRATPMPAAGLVRHAVAAGLRLVHLVPIVRPTTRPLGSVAVEHPLAPSPAATRLRRLRVIVCRPRWSRVVRIRNTKAPGGQARGRRLRPRDARGGRWSRPRSLLADRRARPARCAGTVAAAALACSPHAAPADRAASRPPRGAPTAAVFARRDRRRPGSRGAALIVSAFAPLAAASTPCRDRRAAARRGHGRGAVGAARGAAVRLRVARSRAGARRRRTAAVRARQALRRHRCCGALSLLRARCFRRPRSGGRRPPAFLAAPVDRRRGSRCWRASWRVTLPRSGPTLFCMRAARLAAPHDGTWRRVRPRSVAPRRRLVVPACRAPRGWPLPAFGIIVGRRLRLRGACRRGVSCRGSRHSTVAARMLGFFLAFLCPPCFSIRRLISLPSGRCAPRSPLASRSRRSGSTQTLQDHGCPKRAARDRRDGAACPIWVQTTAAPAAGRPETDAAFFVWRQTALARARPDVRSRALRRQRHARQPFALNFPEYTGSRRRRSRARPASGTSSARRRRSARRSAACCTPQRSIC